MGRAPTSGYCHTCRSRRVKCDRTRPHCLRCTRAGRECKGYELPLRMQSHVVVTDRKGRQQLAVLRADNTVAGPEVTELRLPQRVACSSEELIFSFFFHNYVWAHFWRPIMHVTHAPSDVAYMGSLSVASGIKGIFSNDKTLQIKALDMYGVAVTTFRKQFERALGNKTALAALATTVVVLSMFTFAVDANISLVDHKGVDVILEYCGPEIFQEEPFLTAFRSCRAILICRSLGRGERIFLDQPEWKAIPWSLHPKTADDMLQDISVHLPAIVEELRGPGNLDPKRSLELVARLDELSGELDAWRWAWEEQNGGSARVGTRPGFDTTSIREPVLARLLCSRIEMRSIAHGLDINLYNTLRIYIARLRRILLGDGQVPRERRRLSAQDLEILEATARRHQDSPLLMPGEAKIPCQYALEAARLMPYLGEQLAGRQDAVALMLSPTGINFSALRAQPELEEWAWSLRSKICFLKGPARELLPFDIFT